MDVSLNQKFVHFKEYHDQITKNSPVSPQCLADEILLEQKNLCDEGYAIYEKRISDIKTRIDEWMETCELCETSLTTETLEKVVRERKKYAKRKEITLLILVAIGITLFVASMMILGISTFGVATIGTGFLVAPMALGMVALVASGVADWDDDLSPYSDFSDDFKDFVNEHMKREENGKIMYPEPNGLMNPRFRDSVYKQYKYAVLNLPKPLF